jgi:hypothetical protein
MPDAMADVMGGPNKTQAREIIKRLTGRVVKENPVMKLLTKQLTASLPRLKSQDKVTDPLVRVKFFYPAGSYTSGAIEYDGKDTFFGWVTYGDGMAELGYFSLSEIAKFRGRFGLGIERDRYFDPMPLSQFKKEYP